MRYRGAPSPVSLGEAATPWCIQGVQSNNELGRGSRRRRGRSTARLRHVSRSGFCQGSAPRRGAPPGVLCPARQGRRPVRRARVTGPLTWTATKGGRSRSAAGRPQGKLDGPVIVDSIMVLEARQGFAGAAAGVPEDACAGRLQFPTGGEGQARPELGCLVMSSPGPVAGSGMERSGAASSAQSQVDDPPGGGHAEVRAVCWLRPSWLSSPRSG